MYLQPSCKTLPKVLFLFERVIMKKLYFNMFRLKILMILLPLSLSGVDKSLKAF